MAATVRRVALISVLVIKRAGRDETDSHRSRQPSRLVLYFHLLICLLSRADFKCSFEWFMIRLARLGSGEISGRLDVARIMDNTERQTYGEVVGAAAAHSRS